MPQQQKQYLNTSVFDVEMFAHVNVRGAMSGALTTGDTLTGGTSGATGTIESISTAASATITGVTEARPRCCNLFRRTSVLQKDNK